MFDPDDGWHFCSRCGHLLDAPDVNPDFSLNTRIGEIIDYTTGALEGPARSRHARRIFDLSFTDDGHAIASRQFQAVVDDRCSTPVDFIALEREPDFSVIRPRLQLALDSERAETHRGRACGRCGLFEYVVRPGQWLQEGEVLDPWGMYASAVELMNGRSPGRYRWRLTMLGYELGRCLKPLRGVQFLPLSWRDSDPL